jgi:hypothetical protein
MLWRVKMRSCDGRRNWAVRSIFILVVAIYYSAYAVWKAQLTLAEDFGPRLVDYVLVVSTILLVLNQLWSDRAVLLLNVSALAWHFYFDVFQNCRTEYMSSSLADCGWLSWENIWLPWWLVYWTLQLSLVFFILIHELSGRRRRGILA